jgi:hypothetical protein
MKSLALPFLLLVLATTATHAFAEESAPGIPPELKGFRGMMTGELLEKGETGLIFKVTAIKKVWKANQAEHPEGAVGKTLSVTLDEISEIHRKDIMEHFQALKAGERIELELFDLGKRILCVKEWLRKAAE